MRFLLLLYLFHAFPNKVWGEERACSSNICLNGGSCRVDDESRRFSCLCPPHYSGKLCQDECSLQCINGVCQKGDQGKEYCNCHEGWSGGICDVSGSSVSGCLHKEDCPPLQNCVESSRGLRVCQLDPCNPSPCHNNATCNNDQGDIHCDCPHGFAGRLCDSDVNECELSPCRHGGSCINLEGSFECLCNTPYRGPLCADSPCDPNPCSGVSTCVEMDNDFHCLCPKGFEGKTCNQSSLPTSKCASPCLNGGRCLEGICDCPPGFEGEACQDPTECTVHGKSCLNGGSCVRGLARSYCSCPPDYGGSLCETLEVASPDPCAEKPCHNGGTCHLNPSGIPSCACAPGWFGPLCVSPQISINASCSPNPCRNNAICHPVGDPAEDGFECVCTPGFEGNLCEREFPTTSWESEVSEVTSFTLPSTTSTTAPSVMETVSPNTEVSSCSSCVNAQRCIETVEGAICICDKGSSGEKCDQQGEVCSSASCVAPLVCRPLITPSSTRISCGCPIGAGVPNCSADTSSSFSKDSLFIHQSPTVMIGSSSGPLPFSISLNFRTTVPEAHIVSGENIFGQRLFSVSLASGKVSLNVSGTVYSRLLPLGVNDGQWYSLGLEKTEKDLLVSLVDEGGYQLLSRSLPRLADFDVFSTRIGKMSDSSFFVGCVSDVTIDDVLLLPASSPRAVGVTKGCTRSSQCSSNPCHNEGICEDMWTEARCKCKSPFLPPLCLFSLPPSTFGHNNVSSLAEVSIPSEFSSTLRFSSSIHLLIRSNHPNGSILYLGEAGNDDLATFISIQMTEGHVEVRSRAGGKAVHSLRSERRLNDNQDHAIRLERKQRHVQLFVDDILESEGDIPSRFDHPLFVERMIMGSPEGTTHEAFTVTQYYKGSLQDVRVNDASVVLHDTNLSVEGIGRVNRLENVLEGSVSDDVCSEWAPCQHGVCHNTFNDFQCDCHMGFFGQLCDRKDYCITSPCASGTHCLNVDGGFICTSDISLVESSSLAFSLHSNSSVMLDSVTLSVRTHSKQGRILTLTSGSDVFSISLSHGQLVVATSSPFTIRKTISDGQWKHIMIRDHVLSINNASYGLPRSLQLPSPLSSASLTLGSSASPTPSSFVGCLDAVRIGSQLPPLALVVDGDDRVPSDIAHWKSTERKRVGSSCLSSAQCGTSSPCLNGAECNDMWNTRECICKSGFKGSLCEINIDECQHADCGNGHCVDGVGDYRCECDPGFTGIGCDVPLDRCAEVPCRNQARCSVDNRTATVHCDCTEQWMGDKCDVPITSTCDDSPCKNGGKCSMEGSAVKCACKAPYTGVFCDTVPDPCLSRPCSHGTCQTTRNGHTCICDEGYTGSSCSSLLDSCSLGSCSGQGKCTPIWNGTLCKCDKAWQGAHCSEDINECLSIPCENDAICVNRAGSFECKCRKYYMGDRCEVAGSCLSNPCVHGECIQGKHDEHTCSCEKGYEGENCEKKIDYCRSSSCRNGATCESKDTDYVCHCIRGFTGADCETDIDECALGYCSNGSSCRDRVDDYDCNCEETGFSGKNCTEDVDECTQSESCLHGLCTNTLGGYKCDCQQGFIGRRCSMLNPCLPDEFNRTTHTCLHGRCSNPAVKLDHGHETAIHECVCDRGYAGPQCATKVEERRALALRYLLGPVAAVLLVFCILGCTLFLFVWKGKRAMHGHYSPSNQEMTGARMQMNHMIKLPPEERLI